MWTSFVSSLSLNLIKFLTFKLKFIFIFHIWNRFSNNSFKSLYLFSYIFPGIKQYGYDQCPKFPVFGFHLIIFLLLWTFGTLYNPAYIYIFNPYTKYYPCLVGNKCHNMFGFVNTHISYKFVRCTKSFTIQ